MKVVLQLESIDICTFTLTPHVAWAPKEPCSGYSLDLMNSFWWWTANKKQGLFSQKKEKKKKSCSIHVMFNKYFLCYVGLIPQMCKSITINISWIIRTSVLAAAATSSLPSRCAALIEPFDLPIHHILPRSSLVSLIVSGGSNFMPDCVPPPECPGGKAD